MIQSGVDDERTKAKRNYYFSLTVQRPRRADFAIAVSGRPKSFYDGASASLRKTFDQEIDIGTDGALASGKAPGVVTVTPRENLSGRTVRFLEIDVFDASGKIIASTKTNSAGTETFAIPLSFVGDLDINVRVKDASGEEMAGWVSVTVIDRKKKPFATASGRYFAFDSKAGKYVLTEPPATPGANATASTQQPAAGAGARRRTGRSARSAGDVSDTMVMIRPKRRTRSRSSRRASRQPASP